MVILNGHSGQVPYADKQKPYYANNSKSAKFISDAPPGPSWEVPQGSEFGESFDLFSSNRVCLAMRLTVNRELCRYFQNGKRLRRRRSNLQ